MQFVSHLGDSAERLFGAPGKRDRQAVIAYVEAFERGRKPGTGVAVNTKTDAFEPVLVLRCGERLLREHGFDTGGGPDYARLRVAGTYTETLTGEEGWLAHEPQIKRPLTVQYRVRLARDDEGRIVFYATHDLPAFHLGFVRELATALQDMPEEITDLARRTGGKAKLPFGGPGLTLLPPGRALDGPADGQLLDYSGCSTEDTVTDLQAGALPLGRMAFGFPDAAAPDGGVAYGPALFLGADASGQSMAYKGTLICAPQNSGKTRLILRWALAANRAGMSTLLIDVKGNLLQELEGRLRGHVYHVTTDPREQACDGINVLAGMSDNTPVARQRIRQLVDAILPKEGWEAGEQAYFYQNHVNWLTGLVQVIFLLAHYFPERFAGGEPDLSMVYDVAANENVLYSVVDLVRGGERRAEREGRPVLQPGLDYWLDEIALLMDRAHGGQRTGEYSYRMLTQSITNALRPFSRYGSMYWKTSRGRVGETAPSPGRPFFTLDVLNDPSDPVTIILAAREQDVDDAATFASMAVKRLQHLLFDRMSDASLSRPILLLLDETRRIRSFAPDEYITFARQARAGCVIVYQSLDQIGDDKKIKVILENVGTQIYLGSLTGQTAAHFIGMLPKRRRPVYSSSLSSSLSGEVSQAVQTGHELVDYLSTAELYRLPAGRWPALVYLNTQPRRDPILVDMDETAAAS